MFLTRYLGLRPSLWQRCFLLEPLSIKQYTSFNKYADLSHKDLQNETCTCNRTNSKESLFTRKYYNIIESRKYYSKLVDGDLSDLKVQQHEKELKRTSQLFPQPRVTLNELASKVPQKVFDIQYKQQTVPHRKKMMQGDWACTYAFVWPEKMKFESVAISKRQAAEKAATQAIHWLLEIKRIDKRGNPVYNKEVLEELQQVLDKPFKININEKIVERIDKLWAEYETVLKPIYEEVFKNAAHTSVNIPVLSKDSTLDDDEFSDDEVETGIEEMTDSKPHIHPVYGKSVKPPSQSAINRRQNILEQKFKEYDEELTPLPIDGFADAITSALDKSRVVVIVGAPGCGKSTRAPAAILRSCGVNTTAIVTEPRRVAAIGLAQRVASEMGEEVGESIGYQVRLHSKPPRPPGGSILYCTSGVLLRRLQTNPGLKGCSHVIIDEAHERDVNTDLSLLLLKRALDINPSLKVVIMSATLDTEVFIRYFDKCPVIKVPGRTFPVEVSYLEDIQKKYRLSMKHTEDNCLKEDSKPFVNCEEVVDVIKAVDRHEPEGAILVFLPGWAEIKLAKQLLDQHYGNSSTHMILPVHSRLSTTDQTKMFAKPSPGIRKIVLSTNIAETSITIPDVVYVIDTGAHKENRIREGTGTASLETVWVSQAAAKQRTGRAGRVQAGHCYRLYSKDKESQFTPHTTPEILRIPLEQTVLDCKTYAPEDKVENFLSQLPEPPSREAIQFAVNDLIDLGALTPSEKLTRLGSLVSTMTLHPRLAVGFLHSAVMGTVLQFATAATHCADNVEVFRDAQDRRDEIREIKSRYSKTSDHAALHRIQMEYEEMARKGGDMVDAWCDRLGLRRDRLALVRSLSNLHLEQLLKSGFLPPNPDPDELTRFSDADELSVAALTAGANALMLTRSRVKTRGRLATVTELVTTTGSRAHISGSSVNHSVARSRSPALLAYFGGQHSAERRALVLHCTSVVPPATALVFCKGDVVAEEAADDSETTLITLPRHKLKVHVPTCQADSILKLREMYHKSFEYHISRDLRKLKYEHYTAAASAMARLAGVCRRILRGE